MKPRHAGDAYVNLDTTTALKTCRPISFIPSVQCSHKSMVRLIRRTEKGGDQTLVKTKKYDKPENVKIGEYRLFARLRVSLIFSAHTNVDQIHRRRPKCVIYTDTFIQS